MALTFVSGTKRRFRAGTRWCVEGKIGSVTSAGDAVSAAELGLSSVEVVMVTPEDANVALSAIVNTASDGTTASAGSIFLDSASTTTDAYIRATGRG